MKFRRTAVAVLAISLATGSLAGCKTSTTTTGSAGGHTTGPTSAATTHGSTTTTTVAPINVCSLLSPAKATSLVGKYGYSAATSATIAPGQNQCTYKNTGPLPDMIVIVYQPNSGVSFSTLTNIASADTSVSGVGDKAMDGGIELDVQSGTYIIAVQAAGGIGYGGSFNGAIAVAKAIIPALP